MSDSIGLAQIADKKDDRARERNIRQDLETGTALPEYLPGTWGRKLTCTNRLTDIRPLPPARSADHRSAIDP